MSRHEQQRLLITEMSNFTRKLRADFDAKVGQMGMTLSRVRLLHALLRSDGQGQSELAAALEIETPSLVRILDSMEEQWLIKRCASDEDRRVKKIFLTQEGRTIALRMEDITNAYRDELTKDLSDDEIAIAINIVTRLFGGLSTMSPVLDGSGASK